MTKTTAPNGDNLLASDCPRFSITVDGAHFREHWAELVAIRMPNLRAYRWWSLILGLVAALGLLPLEGLPQWLRLPPRFGVLALCFCVGLGGAYVWKRRLWLSSAERHPRFGQTVVFLVSEGSLIQHPAGTEAEIDSATRNAEVFESPRGYFVRTAVLEDHGLGPKFTQSESVYLPHANLQPPMSRLDFIALIGVG